MNPNETVTNLLPTDLVGRELVLALVNSRAEQANLKLTIAGLSRKVAEAEAIAALNAEGKNTEQRAAAAAAMLVVDAEYQRLISELDATKLELVRQNAVAEAVYLIVRLKAIDASAAGELPVEQVQPDEAGNYVV